MRLDVAECRQRFAAAEHAVLAVNDVGEFPLAVPVTFVLVSIDDVDVVMFAVDQKPKSTPNLRRVRLMRADPRVAVLVERYDRDWNRLWWVRADGHAEVADPDEVGDRRVSDLAELARKYPAYREQPPGGAVVRIRIERWTGWSAGGDAHRQAPVVSGRV